MRILHRRGHAPNEIEVVTRLRRDVDLAMHMAERLTHMGETGAAAAIVGEAAEEVRELVGAMPGPARSTARRRLSRSTVVGVSFVAALGAGSAAAIVGTQPTAPDAQVRIQEPAFEPLREPIVTHDTGDAVEDSGAVEPLARSTRTSDSGRPDPADAITADGPDTDEGDDPDGGWRLPIDPPEIDPPYPLPGDEE